MNLGDLGSNCVIVIQPPCLFLWDVSCCVLSSAYERLFHGCIQVLGFPSLDGQAFGPLYL